jgi:hypothetical protein
MFVLTPGLGTDFGVDLFRSFVVGIYTFIGSFFEMIFGFFDNPIKMVL